MTPRNESTSAILFDREQFNEIRSLAGYNKWTGQKPDNPTAIVREAVTIYLQNCDQSYKKFLEMLDEKN